MFKSVPFSIVQDSNLFLRARLDVLHLHDEKVCKMQNAKWPSVLSGHRQRLIVQNTQEAGSSNLHRAAA